MTITKTFPSGAWHISAMCLLDNDTWPTYCHKTYFGYTKKEAASLFRQEFPKRRKKK